MEQLFAALQKWLDAFSELSPFFQVILQSLLDVLEQLPVCHLLAS
jgi:hypothetical protein